MTHPERIAEAGHDREAGEHLEAERDQHPGSENPERAPAKKTNDPARVNLPYLDHDRGSEEARDRL